MVQNRWDSRWDMFGLTHVVADDVQGLFQRSGSPRRLIEDQCQEEMRQMHEKRQMERGSKSGINQTDTQAV